MQRIFGKNCIIDENYSLSEYIKIPMAPFIPKSTPRLRSALHFSYSIVIRRFYSRANTVQPI